MTEMFGICGIGWKYEIVKIWSEQGNANTFAFAEVNLYVKQGDKWSDAIPASGGSMLIQKESAGLHDNDEAYKMAITDALGTAMKMLGVAADVYMGLWDGSKYRDIPAGTTAQPPKQADKSTKTGTETIKPGEAIVEAVTEKSGTSTDRKTGKPKPWTLYGVKINGIFYNTFDSTFAETAKEALALKMPVEFTSTKTEKGHNLDSILIVTAQAPQSTEHASIDSDQQAQALEMCRTCLERHECDKQPDHACKSFARDKTLTDGVL